MRTWVSSLVVGACSFTSILARSEPRAQSDASTAVARQAFEQGLTHFQKGEFDAAIADFEAALQSRPHPAVLFNLGLGYAAAGLPLKAVATLQRYLADLGTKLPPARLSVVNSLIDTQKKLLGTISITNTDPGIAISIDGVDVGTTPLGPLSVVRGSHALVGMRAGFMPAIVAVQVEGSQNREVQLQLVASSGPESVVNEGSRTSVPNEPPSPQLRIERVAISPLPVVAQAHVLEHVGIASLGVAVAAMGFGTYFALRTHASWADRQHHCSSGVCDDQAVEAWRDAKRSAFTADLSFASALVAGGVGIYLLVVQHRDATQVPAARVRLVNQAGTWQVQWLGTL